MSSSPIHLTGPQNGNDKPERDGLAIVPILVALGIVAMVGVFAYQLLAPNPVGTVALTKANAVEMPPGDRVVVEVELAIQNTTDKPLKYHSAEIKLITDANKEGFKDAPASSFEMPRIYQSYPALKQSTETPLKQDTIVAPGATLRGSAIVAFPVSKAAFDARQHLAATVYFNDKAPIHTPAKK
ncbi:MAG: hypothetical protein ABIP81_03500 [Terriglobales bacterium]